MYRNYDNTYSADMSDMIGLTFTAIKDYSDTIEFFCDIGMFKMYHSQDCCETVYVESIVGDLSDLIGEPILSAEESSNSEYSDRYESATWTFYKLATRKGYVDIRWLGTSNGYYSESVSIAFIPLPSLS